MKILFIVLDGLGDELIPCFNNKTPLEAANTPNLDNLAKTSLMGLLKPDCRGAIPTSEEGHSLLFGYDIFKYPLRRGIFEAMGLGIKLDKNDVVLRGNFVIANKNWNILDRRAGRIEKTEPLIKALSKIKIKGVKTVIKKGPEHRFVLILKGRGLSWEVTDSDPFYQALGNKILKIKGHKKTADILNEFSQKAYEVLKEFPANHILLRGASSLVNVPSFEKKYGLRASCIAGKPLYKGIAEILGMKVLKIKQATGKFDTNLKVKFQTAEKELKTKDFVFLHIKATDSLAEDGDYLKKKEFIEKVDKYIKPLKDTLLVVTSDHSTCSLLKRHCLELIPFLIYPGNKKFTNFSEKQAKKGKIIKQIDLMELILNQSR